MNGNALLFEDFESSIPSSLVDNSKEELRAITKQDEEQAHDDLLSKRSETEMEKNNAYHAKMSIKVPFFSNDGPCTLTKNSFVLFGAVTGSGKTTVAKQIAAHAILNKQRVLVCMNEVGARNYLVSIFKLVRNQMPGINDKDIMKYILKHISIHDKESSDMALCSWDQCVPFINAQMTGGFDPDIVIFDQLNNCTETKEPGNAKGVKQEYERLNHVCASIAASYTKEETNSLPPFIMFQQASAGKEPMMNLLRGTRSSLTHASLGVMLTLEKTDNINAPMITKLKIEKNRFGDYIKPTAFETQWFMDKKGWLTPYSQNNLLANKLSGKTSNGK